MTPLLSIVVPTKNRYIYLFELIKLLASFKRTDFEMVIQDNSTNNKQFIDNINLSDYPFISYYYQSEPLSQSGNSDLSIVHAKGEYICFIGDDDGVTRHIFNVVEWMKQNDFTILKSALSVYKWPSFKSPKHYDVGGSYHFNDFSYTYRKVNCKDMLDKLLKSGISSLAYMPKVYNGIVKKETLNKIYSKFHTYFPGPSPDMANAVSLALEEDNYVYVDFPIIIAGHSINLGAGAGRYKNGLGPLDEQPFIDQKYKDGWSTLIPRVWAARTVWPESAVCALRAYNEQKYLNCINYDLVLRLFAVDHISYIGIAVKLSNSKIKLIFSVIYHVLINYVMSIYSYYLYRRKEIFEGLQIHKGLYNIVEAEKFISEIHPIFNVQSANHE